MGTERRGTTDCDAADEGFFTVRQAARLARVPRSTLNRWVRQGVATPSQRVVDREGNTVAEGFSLADVGYLHLLRHLTRADVPLEDAVSVLYHLIARFGAPSDRWRTADISVEPPTRTGSGRKKAQRVFARLPDEWGTTVAVPGRAGAGQRAALDLLDHILPAPVSLETILIPAQYLGAVEIDARKAGGIPVARGTTVRADVIRQLLDRYPITVFLTEYYPHVGEEKARLCQQFDRELDEAA